MRRALDVARQYHGHIREANRGGWSDLAHLLSDPQSKISSQIVWNWVNRKLPERIEFFLAEKIGCPVSELRGTGSEETTKIDEESMTPEERIIVSHYRRAEPDKQAALFKIITGQARPTAPPDAAGVNVVPFKHKKRR